MGLNLKIRGLLCVWVMNVSISCDLVLSLYDKKSDLIPECAVINLI